MSLKKVNWGIIGTGNIANKFAEAFKYVDNANLLAIGSRDIHKAKYFAEKYSILKYYGNYQNLINDKDIDIIYIATPATYHFEHILMCINSRKNVFCEKPFTINVKEALKAYELANQNNLFIGEALWSAYLPWLAIVNEYINEKKIIGEILGIESKFLIKVSPDHRLYKNELGGGALIDLGIYNIFITYSILGQPLDFEAKAIIKNNVDETITIKFLFFNNVYSIMKASINENNDINAIIYGSKGKIILNSPFFGLTNIFIYDHKNNLIFNITPQYEGNGYNYEIKEISNFILQGQKDSNIWSMKDTINILKILDDVRNKIGLKYTNDIIN